MINISICLSDLPKSKIKLSDNGKMYCNLVVAERREKGRFDETHYVALSQTQEERKAGEPKVYVGSGKEYNPQPQQPTPEAIDNMPTIGDDDGLPF